MNCSGLAAVPENDIVVRDFFEHAKRQPATGASSMGRGLDSPCAKALPIRAGGNANKGKCEPYPRLQALPSNAKPSRSEGVRNMPL